MQKKEKKVVLKTTTLRNTFKYGLYNKRYMVVVAKRCIGEENVAYIILQVQTLTVFTYHKECVSISTLNNGHL